MKKEAEAGRIGLNSEANTGSSTKKKFGMVIGGAAIATLIAIGVAGGNLIGAEADEVPKAAADLGLAPKKFPEARVLIELNERPVFPLIADPTEKLWESAPADVATEIGIIGGPRVLEVVVLENDLVKLLEMKTREEAIAWLRARISVRAAGGRLVEIIARVPSGDWKLVEGGRIRELSPERLSEAVVEAYAMHTEEIARDQRSRLLEELKLETKAQEKMMEESRTRLLSLYKNSNITDIAEPGEELIVTPLKLGVRSGTIEFSDEVGKKLLDEERRMVEAQSAKADYLHRGRVFLQLEESIARASMAAKMPLRFITVH